MLAGIAVLFLVVSCGLSALSQAKDGRYSPLDEISHQAYAYSIAHGEIPYGGSVYPQKIVQDWSCRRQVNLGPTALPRCGSGRLAATYPLGGLQYNYTHPPAYYAVTGTLARMIDAPLPGFRFVVIVRWLSAIWVAAGMFCLYLTLRYWRAPRLVSVITGLASCTVPWILHAARTGTNDAPAVLCGVAALFVLGRVFRYRRYGWLLPGLLGFAVAATKVMSAAAILAAGLLIGIVGICWWVRRGRSAGWPLVRIAVAIAAGVSVVYVGWTVLQNARTLVGYTNPIRKPPQHSMFNGLPFAEWFSAEFHGFNLVRGGYLHPITRGPYLTGWQALLGAVIVAASFAGLLAFGWGSARRMVAAALFTGCLLWPILIQIERYIGSGGLAYWPTYTSRYGMSLIPVALAVVALLLARRRGLRRIWYGYVAAGLVIVLGTTAGVLTG